MPDDLEVDLGEEGPHSISVSPSTIEVDDDFDVVLRNHGAGLHVHLAFDDAIASAASLRAVNHYVDDDGVRRVSVRIDGSRAPTEGRLEVVTGYGAETEFATVRVVGSGEAEDGIPVDESLAEPPPREEEPAVDPAILPLVALGAVAVLFAALAVVLVSETVALIVTLALIAAGTAAAALLVR